jgi:hypothetical protein
MAIHFEFLGGPYDGQFFCTDSKDRNEAQAAEGFAALTERGRIGAPVTAIAPASLSSLASKTVDINGMPTHVYRVTERLEDGRTVLVRSAYEGVRSGR